MNGFPYLDPFQRDNALGKAYQLTHSLIAFGRGELFGVGLGASVEKIALLAGSAYRLLLAVIGEELGYVGVVTVIFCSIGLSNVPSTSVVKRLCSMRPSPALAAKGVEHLDWRANLHQHGRESRCVADQGFDFTPDELRWLGV